MGNQLGFRLPLATVQLQQVAVRALHFILVRADPGETPWSRLLPQKTHLFLYLKKAISYSLSS